MKVIKRVSSYCRGSARRCPIKPIEFFAIPNLGRRTHFTDSAICLTCKTSKLGKLRGVSAYLKTGRKLEMLALVTFVTEPRHGSTSRFDVACQRCLEDSSKVHGSLDSIRSSVLCELSRNGVVKSSCS